MGLEAGKRKEKILERFRRTGPWRAGATGEGDEGKQDGPH